MHGNTKIKFVQQVFMTYVASRVWPLSAESGNWIIICIDAEGSVFFSNYEIVHLHSYKQEYNPCWFLIMWSAAAENEPNIGSAFWCVQLGAFTVTLGMTTFLKILNSLEDSTDPCGGQLTSQRYISVRACSCIWSCESIVVTAQLQSCQLSFLCDITDGMAKFRCWLSVAADEDSQVSSVKLPVPPAAYT
jgi:hypothetical protein